MIGNYEVFHLLYLLSIFFSMNALFILDFMKKEKYKVLFSFFIIVFISLVIGLREDNIGLDSAQYAAMYMGTFEREGVEPLFALVGFVFGGMFPDYSFFFLFSSLLINALILLSFKKITIHYPLAMALFLSTFLFINLNINVMRQAYAVAFAFYAVASLMRGEVKKYWIFLLLAIFAHFTAAIFVVVYFLRKMDLNDKKIVVIILLSVILYSIKFSDFFYYIKDYSDYLTRIYCYFSWDGLIPWRFKHIYYLAILLIGFYATMNHYKRADSDDKLFLLFYLYGFLLVLLFKEEEMVADRIFYYFIFFGIVLIINISKFLKEKVAFYILVLFGMNAWFLKSSLVQFPSWFMPPFEGIRWAQ